MGSDRSQLRLPTDLPELPFGWQWVPLSDLIDPGKGICYGIVQPGAHDPSGIPMVNSGDILSGQIPRKTSFNVSAELSKKYRRSTLQGGEVLLTLVGANFGQVAIAPPSYAGHNCSRAVGVLPIQKSKEYVVYALRSPVSRHFMNIWANTTAQPTFNLGDVARLPIPIAPSDEERAIVSVLEPLDQKITLLQETNATLEAIAQAIFKSWFVDFDPVRAKAEGRDPEGVPPEVVDLFPSEFEDSELGAIPKGWRVAAFQDLTEVLGGSTPSTKDPMFWEDGVHYWATPKDLSGMDTPVLLETERKITDAGLEKISSGLLPTGTVLLSSRAPIGYLAITEVPVAVNQGFIAMKARRGVSNLFLLRMVQARMDDIKSHANGSTFMEISKGAFRPIQVLVPSAELIQAFDGLVRPLYQRLVGNQRERATLTELRDALLPRLMSGKLRVSEPAEAL